MRGDEIQGTGDGKTGIEGCKVSEKVLDYPTDSITATLAMACLCKQPFNGDLVFNCLVSHMFLLLRYCEVGESLAQTRCLIPLSISFSITGLIAVCIASAFWQPSSLRDTNPPGAIQIASIIERNPDFELGGWS